MNAVECLLKSENFSAAARLDPLSPDAPVWLELAAAWRIRALEEDHGIAKWGIAQESHALLERKAEIELWDAIAPAARRH
jgi:hypothetical protein